LEPTHSGGHEGGAQQQQLKKKRMPTVLPAEESWRWAGSFKVQTPSSPVPRHSNVVPASATMQAPKNKKIRRLSLRVATSIRSEGGRTHPLPMSDRLARWTEGSIFPSRDGTAKGETD
jgi:hypothetical protein